MKKEKLSKEKVIDIMKNFDKVLILYLTYEFIKINSDYYYLSC